MAKQLIKVKCPYCGTSKSESKGVRNTKQHGARQRRMCLGCGGKFSVPISSKKTSKKKKR